MLALLLLLLTSSQSDSLLAAWKVKSNQSLVLARIVVLDTGKHRLTPTRLEVSGGGGETESKIDDSGLAVFKLKPGIHEIEELRIGKQKVELREGYMKFEVPPETPFLSLGTVTFRQMPPPARDRVVPDGGIAATMAPGTQNIIGYRAYATGGNQIENYCPWDASNFLEEDAAEALFKKTVPGLTPKRIRLEVDRINN